MDSRATPDNQLLPSAAVAARREIARLVELHHGFLSQIEVEVLERAPGYLGKVVRGEVDLKLDQEQAIIEALGESWPAYQARRAAPIDVLSTLESLFDAEAEEPRACAELRWAAQKVIHAEVPASKEAPTFSRSLLRAFKLGDEDQRLDILRRPKARSTAFVRAVAEILDEDRYTHPITAAKLSRVLTVEVVPKISAPKVVEAFAQAAGVFASAHRVAGNLDLAARALRTVVLVSPRAGTTAYVKALQRTACVIQDKTRYNEALAICRVMAGLLAKRGDYVRLGQVLVDTGNSYLLQNEMKASMASFETALRLLPHHARRYRMAALYGLSRIHGLQDDEKKAEKYLAKAEHIDQTSQPAAAYDQAMLAHARGRALQRTGNLRSAEEMYRKARDLLRNINPVDCLLFDFDLVDSLFRQGKASQARAEAKSAAALPKRLSGFPHAEELLTEFVRSALSGELETASISAATQQLEALHGLQPEKAQAPSANGSPGSGSEKPIQKRDL